MSNVAGVISFKAKPGQGEEVARLIANALPHVEQEPGTLTWLVLRSDAIRIWCSLSIYSRTRQAETLI